MVKPPTAALATRADRHVFGPGWIYERKLDGERCLATKTDGSVALHSRTGRDITGSFPAVVDALESQDTPGFVIDGEAVVFDGDQTSFAAIQPLFQVTDAARARATGIEVTYYVFDVLAIDDNDTRRLPLVQRKELLADLLDYRDPIRFSEHRADAGSDYLAEACSHGWEGLIAKRSKASYPSGRSSDWIKLKCERGQEFVVGGYSDPQGSRSGFGALLLGYFDGDDFVYAGKVGTGFDRATLLQLFGRLERLSRQTSPFVRGGPPLKGVHWVRPVLIVQVAFSEWTGAGQLRHPRYLGLRRDKEPADVVRE
jgi:bifunctional non-homologous end joining protein LigD